MLTSHQAGIFRRICMTQLLRWGTWVHFHMFPTIPLRRVCQLVFPIHIRGGRPHLRRTAYVRAFLLANFQTWFSMSVPRKL